MSVLLVMQVISYKTNVTNYMCNFLVCISIKGGPSCTYPQNKSPTRCLVLSLFMSGMYPLPCAHPYPKISHAYPLNKIANSVAHNRFQNPCSWKNQDDLQTQLTEFGLATDVPERVGNRFTSPKKQSKPPLSPTPETFRIEKTSSHQGRRNQDSTAFYGVTVQNMFL